MYQVKHVTEFFLLHFRLTIAEEGCARILNHRSSSHTLVQLCRALGADETGTGLTCVCDQSDLGLLFSFQNFISESIFFFQCLSMGDHDIKSGVNNM